MTHATDNTPRARLVRAFAAAREEGPRPASAALTTARLRLAQLEEATAASSAAWAAAAEARTAFPWLYHPARLQAEEAAKAADKRKARLISDTIPRGPSYGAGSWAQGEAEAVPSSAPFGGRPPAMRREGYNRGAPEVRAMRPEGRALGGALFWAHGPDAGGALRNVRPAGDVLGGRAQGGGWYTDDSMEGLCIGLVAQLRAQDGRAVFAAGYGFTEEDGRAFDLRARRLHVAADSSEDAAEDAAREAARAAEDMAERAAEEARDHAQAYALGQDFARAKEEAQAAREEVRELLAERRRLKAQAGAGEAFPALCGALRATIRRTLGELARARITAADALRDAPTSDALRRSWADGAELEGFPG